MEKYIYGEMKEVLTNLEYISPEKENEKTQIVSSYEMEIAEKDKEIGALLDKLVFANDALTSYINLRVQELDKSKRELLEKMLQISNSELNRSIEKITDYVDKWDALSITDKQKIVDILIKVIYIGDEEIEIEWNI